MRGAVTLALMLLVGCARLGFGSSAAVDGAADTSPPVDGHLTDAGPVDTAPPDRNPPHDGSIPPDLAPAEGELPPDLSLALDTQSKDAGPLGTWVLETLPGSSSDGMHDVWVTPTQVFVAGDSGKVFLNAGGVWSSIKPSISTHLYVVRGFATGGVVVAGDDSQVLLYGNKTWVQMPLPTPSVTVTGVWGTVATDLWVISSSTIWRSNTSGGYTTVAGCPGVSYEAIHGTSATDIWLAGAAGAICHYDGTSFTQITNNLSGADLWAVWVDPSGVVWLTGSGGTILRLSGSGLQSLPSGTTEPLYGIWGAAANNIWAVGRLGTIVHFDGTSWTKVPSPTSQHLSAVWGSSASRVYAVGGKNTALKLQP